MARFRRKKTGFAQALAQVFEIINVQKLGSELLRVERGVEAADRRHCSGSLFGPVELCVRGGEHDAAEICAFGQAIVGTSRLKPRSSVRSRSIPTMPMPLPAAVTS